MKTKDFDYYLPEELIAQTPLEKRDESRLMRLDKETGAISHQHFYELPEFLKPGDCLILNNSRVLPARLLGRRLPGGGACEVLLLIDRGDKTWECIVRPGKHLRKGARMEFGNGELTAEVVDVLPDGNRMVKFAFEGIFLEVLERLGKMPLPPYIKEELADQERYQTVYSEVNGSAAAPTAGLHFTPELLKTIQKNGVNIGYVTLHVGLGTFRPVKEDDIEQHDMHSEYCTIPQETADLINRTKVNGGRVICVGTTSCRTIESWAGEDGTMTATGGWTNIYIYPGYRFKVMDALVTNFHLPESTLIMLVSALAGREHILNAYKIAVENRYRFFSFGDAMFIADGLDAGSGKFVDCLLHVVDPDAVVMQAVTPRLGVRARTIALVLDELDLHVAEVPDCRAHLDWLLDATNLAALWGVHTHVDERACAEEIVIQLCRLLDTLHAIPELSDAVFLEKLLAHGSSSCE